MTIPVKSGKWTPVSLLEAAESAVSSEIEAVREQPSSDVLTNGKLIRSPANEEFHYRFETSNRSLHFAEHCQAALDGETVTIYPVETGEEFMVFRFPKNFGNVIAETELEWENDFVLRKIRESLLELSDSSVCLERIQRMLQPPETYHETELPDTQDDGIRNVSQREAIKKAMIQPVSFIWGPPGTGKTVTLAYIMANYVLRGKKVLFVSNTNRAVDHGMLEVMNALQALEVKSAAEKITRFGERILEEERLDRIHFEKQLDKKMESQKKQAVELQQWLDALNMPDLAPEQRQHVEKKIERLGGVEYVEEQIQELIQKERYAFSHLRRYKVVGTTLARVCTSDLLETMSFDAVVVDEASMAGIPYMVIMASKAKDHLVIVGDPMQLPPIAITTDMEARNLLEQDVFATLSGAGSTGELFKWHDDNAGYTSFFNIQYRMQSDLARVISDVFYNGRLISASEASDEGEDDMASGESSGSVGLLDSSPYLPHLRQEGKRKGFQPVNDVHLTLINDLVRRLLVEFHFSLKDIGVIVPFRASAWHLRRELRGKNRWYDLEIGTIHTFQGREKKVIILDTVMSGESRNGVQRHYSVRLFDEAKNGLAVPRLLNVAFSRSREQFIVIADMNHIRRVYGQKFLGKLLNRLPVRSIQTV